MFVLTALTIAGWAVTIALFLRSVDKARREHARREDLLVNQVCSLAGRPWQTAPAEREPVAEWEPMVPATDWVNDPEVGA